MSRPDRLAGALSDRYRIERELGQGGMATPTTGGCCPLWAPDGRRVFFRNADRLVAVDLRTAPTLAVVGRTTSPGFWAGGATTASNYDDVAYDLSPDGRTFVAATRVRTDARVLVAFNWAEELRREWQAGGRK